MSEIPDFCLVRVEGVQLRLGFMVQGSGIAVRVQDSWFGFMISGEG